MVRSGSPSCFRTSGVMWRLIRTSSPHFRFFGLSSRPLTTFPLREVASEVPHDRSDGFLARSGVPGLPSEIEALERIILKYRLRVSEPIGFTTSSFDPTDGEWESW